MCRCAPRSCWAFTTMASPACGSTTSGVRALEGSDDTKLVATLRSGVPAPGPSEIKLASSRPFAPQSAAPIRGAVPLPTERPFELGHNETTAQVAKRLPANEFAAITRQPIAPLAAQRKTSVAAAPKLASAVASKPIASDQREHGFAARFAPASNLPTAPTRAEPVSAFAGPAIQSGAVISGRGLYYQDVGPQPSSLRDMKYLRMYSCNSGLSVFHRHTPVSAVAISVKGSN